MVKRSFKMGGTGKVVVVVPESDSDAGTMPAIVESPVTGEEGGQGSDVGEVDTGALADVTLPGAKVDHADLPEGWRFAGGETDQNEVADNGQGGSVMLDGMGAIIDVLACEPDVINVLQALRADDDGMPVNDAEVVPMLRIAAPITNDAQLDVVLAQMAESIADVPPMILVGDADVADVAIDVVASEPELSPFAALVAAFVPTLAQPETEGLDYVVCGSRVELSVARFMAQQMADKLGSVMKVAYVGPGFGQGGDMFFPGQGGKRASGGSGSVRTAKPAASGGATAEAGNVVRLTPGLTVAGDWLTYDARVVCTHPGNASNIKTWQKIRDAAARLDLDTLRAFDFAGARDDTSGNTYTKNNGRFLRAHIAKCEAAQAALDAEFGFACAAD